MEREEKSGMCVFECFKIACHLRGGVLYGLTPRLALHLPNFVLLKFTLLKFYLSSCL